MSRQILKRQGAHIVFFTNLKGSENESIGVAGANGGSAAQTLRDGRIDVFPGWTPDGSRVIYFSQKSVGASEAEYRSVALSGGAPESILPTSFNP